MVISFSLSDWVVRFNITELKFYSYMLSILSECVWCETVLSVKLEYVRQSSVDWCPAVIESFHCFSPNLLPISIPFWNPVSVSITCSTCLWVNHIIYNAIYLLSLTVRFGIVLRNLKFSAEYYVHWSQFSDIDSSFYFPFRLTRLGNALFRRFTSHLDERYINWWCIFKQFCSFEAKVLNVKLWFDEWVAIIVFYRVFNGFEGLWGDVLGSLIVCSIPEGRLILIGMVRQLVLLLFLILRTIHGVSIILH